MSAALGPVEARPGPAAPGKGKRRQGSPHVAQAATRAPSAADRARQDRKRRIAGEATPPRRSEAATWPCPDDKANTRTPPTIKGRRRSVGVVARLFARGSAEITRAHVEAAHLLSCAWAGARVGYTSRSLCGESSGRTAAGPTQGPPATAVRQSADAATVQRAFRAVGPAAVPFVLLDGGDLAGWCAMQAGLTGRKPCAKCAMGRLLGCLDRLLDVFGLPHDAGPDQDRVRP